MKTVLPLLLSGVMLAVMTSSVSACTSIYAGSELTKDGETLLGRSEDFWGSLDYPKTFDVYEAGAHRQGEEYKGCYGFTWSFTHDSYGYTGFSDDNSQGVCPDCGNTHEHTPYQAGGTNEKGVTVTATETLYQNTAVGETDPYPENGIEEAEITTVLLSEAASAREGMELLTSVYSTDGSNSGAGVFIADREESWYIECLSGTQYIAVKLNPDMLVINPNLSVIGRIDLDDHDNVISSDRLIETAVRADTFVGDQEANIIDFAASYEGEKALDSLCRLGAGLNHVTCTEDYQTDESELKKSDIKEIDPAVYTITNLDQDDSIVPLHTGIVPGKAFSLEDMIDMYRTLPITRYGNVSTHLFQIDPDDETAAGIVEWIGFSYCKYSVFMPYYPMLTTEVAPMLSTGYGQPEYTEEEPDEDVWFKWINQNDQHEEYVIFPDGWENSMFWIFDGLMDAGYMNEESAEEISEAAAGLQEEVFKDWAVMKETVEAAIESSSGPEAKSSSDPETESSSDRENSAASEAATRASMEISRKVYESARDILSNYVDIKGLS